MWVELTFVCGDDGRQTRTATPNRLWWRLRRGSGSGFGFGIRNENHDRTVHYWFAFNFRSKILLEFITHYIILYCVWSSSFARPMHWIKFIAPNWCSIDLKCTHASGLLCFFLNWSDRKCMYTEKYARGEERHIQVNLLSKSTLLKTTETRNTRMNEWTQIGGVHWSKWTFCTSNKFLSTDGITQWMIRDWL